MGNDSQQIATVTGSAAQLLPRFLSSISEHASRIDPRLRPQGELALTEAKAKLEPVSKKQFAAHLTACLILVAPSGMTEADRTEWLRAAWITLDGIPEDLLDRGCAVARKFCDHPAKIVPAIMREAESIWNQRRANCSAVEAALAKMNDPEDDAPRCTPEEARQIMEQVGIKPDDGKRDRSHRGEPIAPDADWYRQHGVEIDDTPSGMKRMGAAA
jgi:hypothetical protein